jgi:hypothetical protein
MGARTYAPLRGRFLSVDPRQGGCANDYAYVFGDPINHTDLSGRTSDWLPECAHLEFETDQGKVIGRVSNGTWQLAFRPHVSPAAGATYTLVGWQVEQDGETVVRHLGAEPGVQDVLYSTPVEFDDAIAPGTTTKLRFTALYEWDAPFGSGVSRKDIEVTCVW